MTGEGTDKELEDDDVSDDVSDDLSDDEADDEADDDLLLGDDDGFADTIIEANVDALIAKIELTDAEEAARKRQARKRLEELRELKNSALDDTFNFDLEDND